MPSTVKDIFKDAVKNNKVSCNSRSLALEEDYSNSDTIYKWQNQLQANDSITTFKTGETGNFKVSILPLTTTKIPFYAED